MHTPDTALQIATRIPSPEELNAMNPLAEGAAKIITRKRQEVVDVINGVDSRIIACVGPCSMDATVIGGKYTSVLFAERLQEVDVTKEGPLIIMRDPMAKPRSNTGWRGLEHDSIEEAHKILTLIANTGMPLASEVMTAAHLARYGNRLSLAWVGARNIGDTLLRHALSAYPSLPTGLKNDGSGNPQPAIDARLTIAESQDNVEIMMPDGHMGIVPQTPGNPNTMLIWRGGDMYKTPEAYEEGIIAISALGKPWAADMAHGGSVAHGGKKSVEGQQACLDHVLQLMLTGRLATPPRMLMIEAHLLPGADTSGGTPGMSRTDACVGFSQLTDMLEQINVTHDTLVSRG